MLSIFFLIDRLLDQVRNKRAQDSHSRCCSPNENGMNVSKNCAQNLSTKRIRLDDYGAMIDQNRINSNKKNIKTNFKLSSSCINSNTSDNADSPKDCSQENNEYNYQCLAVNISPELGERVCISGERALIEDVFPEISQNIMDSNKAAVWNQDSKHVIRFPLNGYCKLNSLQTIVRLLNYGFKVMASNGGGVEGQQFSEYLMVRKCSSSSSSSSSSS